MQDEKILFHQTMYCKLYSVEGDPPSKWYQQKSLTDSIEPTVHNEVCYDQPIFYITDFMVEKRSLVQ